ncbi:MULTISPECIES: histidine kinase dimerization/phospho-acceptor domain-containing protein [unclassified Mucilaginibacter]|uniref:histidine kinase dimerization/phospho-acceptor domain-containing protein n=1 Tax=unclassified Mucilaginibacter TaxID=2617802 RepID=UPI002AC9C964|nr:MULTISPECIES: histidine kinase dimerization/phospho-acceptor domain-containing protein [unclassified Mucilaginibacter]MEB0249512.1 histidine kinase dimerization/phospho-acceptor domain-containing protein [Mucilaginibacter sp. 5B2]MEB0263687.1 histidine kinase dimerization/phospho-acceptor domain-containing protein [Mucilaginibacter sp. 10I4]MEB0280790.1 histidine kinase dimerization/phospho-acceptor domain-containing protein [Mucilaginibacter sp. 10B2]MEB0303072.1 histidine kinase dimerizati
MAEGKENKPVSHEAVDMLKHDIKNQLSNIYLALEGLRYEVEDQSSDLGLYMDSITQSAQKIDKLLGDFE